MNFHHLNKSIQHMIKSIKPKNHSSDLLVDKLKNMLFLWKKA